MGLKILSMVFQRLIDCILRDAHSFPSSLIDDIVCHSITFEEHVSHLREVLTWLRNAGLTANTVKCQFVLTRLKCWQNFGRRLIKIHDEKIDNSI